MQEIKLYILVGVENLDDLFRLLPEDGTTAKLVLAKAGSTPSWKLVLVKTRARIFKTLQNSGIID
ncbi:MAG: hypothetical protein OXJ52_03415 [Oligoflexia bacterium]|nr:hypothetical protein [Oligoflexia bacterium]